MTRAHQTCVCELLARDAMLYYIVLEYSMYSIWIVLTIISFVVVEFCRAAMDKRLAPTYKHG